MPELSARLREVLKRLKVDPAEHDAETMPSTDVDDAALEDLRDIPFVTIDNEGSRDLDQALHIARREDGWLVRYAIADASHFVRPDTPLWDQALKRGASFYLPGFAVPMLPRFLSEDVVSLNPDVIRRALVFVTEVAEDGEVVGTQFVRATIRSIAKLTYEGVQKWFDDGRPDTSWASAVEHLEDLGEARAARARARGVVEFNRNETEVRADGENFVFRTRTRLDVERWNEQLSLLCNTEGARLLSESEALDDDLASVYRVHLPPLSQRLYQLEEQLAAVVRHHDLDERWRWKRGESLAEYLRTLPSDPWRVRRAIELQIRYTNRASEYSDRVGPHHALAVDHYARFSAPMREIVGIFTHKEALEALGFSKASDADEDRRLRAQVIAAGNAARKLQKRIDNEVKLLAIADLLDGDLELPAEKRPWRSGTVIGSRKNRAYVELDKPACDLKVYGKENLSLGDAVELRVEKFDGRYRFETRAL